MAISPTPKRGYLRPRLGTRPWKNEWDYNFTKLDSDVGGLLDGTLNAKNAENVVGIWYAAHTTQVSGDLNTGGLIADGTSQDIRVDHSADVIFDLPCEPIVEITLGGVHATLLADRQNLTNGEYGGGFVVRVENTSGADIDPAFLTWTRKGWKFA